MQAVSNYYTEEKKKVRWKFAQLVVMRSMSLVISAFVFVIANVARIFDGIYATFLSFPMATFIESIAMTASVLTRVSHTVSNTFVCRSLNEQNHRFHYHVSSKFLTVTLPKLGPPAALICATT